MGIILLDLGIAKYLWKFLIWLVTGIYQFVGYAYQVFLELAKLNIFTSSDYNQVATKIYVVLGVIMLFVVAYNILTLIIDPDKNKGGAAVEKLLKNIVISFIMIVLTPSLFAFAFNVQKAVLNQNVLGNIFYDNSKSSITTNNVDNTDSENGAYLMSSKVFSAFFLPNTIDANPTSKDNCNDDGPCTLTAAEENAEKNGDFSYYSAFAENISSDDLEADERVSFNWLIALIAGGFLLYVIVSFCFDLAVRVIKLVFYQIVAPIAIACRIIPNQEKIFTSWWKVTLKTFISVFLRVFIMNLGIFLITIFTKKVANDKLLENLGNTSGPIEYIVIAFVILGIVAFIRQAPKLLDEIFGFGLDDLKLGWKDTIGKAAAGGVFLAGSIAGSAVTGTVRGATQGGFKSAISGFFGGTYRGAKNGLGAKDYSSMKSSINKSTNDTVAQMKKAQKYRNTGANWFTRTYVGGSINDAYKNTVSGIKTWATGESSASATDKFMKTIQVSSDMNASFDAIDAQANNVFNKVKGNVTPNAITPNLTKKDFKDSDTLFNLYDRYKDKTFNEIETDINYRKSYDPATLIDRNRYTSQDAYIAAVNEARQKQITEAVNLDQVYSIMKSKSINTIENAAYDNPNQFFVAGKPVDLTGVNIAIKEFDSRFKINGSSVTDIDQKQYKNITSFGDIENINKAYKNVGNDAKQKSTDLRLKAQANQKKDDKK